MKVKTSNFMKLKKTLNYFLLKTLLDALTCQGVEEADRAEEGFYIRSGITVVLKNATIKDGTVV